MTFINQVEGTNNLEDISLAQNIRAYIQDRLKARLEPIDKHLAKLGPEDEAKREELENKRAQLISLHKYDVWLDDAVSKTPRIDAVTHAIKYNHSSAKGAGALALNVKSIRGYVSTGSIKISKIDIATDAGNLGIAKLVSEVKDSQGRAMLDYLLADDITPLLELSSDPERVTRWVKGFKQILTPGELASHSLSKQVFWPVTRQQHYHLISPLFASSLMHEVYSQVNHTRFSEQAIEARKARKDKKSCEYPDRFFPELAMQGFGGTKPRNVSQLNNHRGGKGYLFSSAPPDQWTSRFTPPKQQVSMFGGALQRRLNDDVYFYRRFLLKHREKDNNRFIEGEGRARFEAIVDDIVTYIAQVHGCEAGWSEASHLPLHQQVLLDPKRREWDAEFNDYFEAKSWQDKMSKEFALWFSALLNKGLKGEARLQLGKPVLTFWQNQFAQRLRLLLDILDPEEVEGLYQ